MVQISCCEPAQFKQALKQTFFSSSFFLLFFFFFFFFLFKSETKLAASVLKLDRNTKNVILIGQQLNRSIYPVKFAVLFNLLCVMIQSIRV